MYNDDYWYIKVADTWRMQRKPVYRVDRLTTLLYYPEEIFATAERYPNVLIGSFGTIYDINKKAILHRRLINSEYLSVGTMDLDYGKVVTSLIHRMVLLAFDPIPNYRAMQGNHKNGNKWMNWITNLEWRTPKENTDHAHKTGLVEYKYPKEVVIRLCQELSKGIRVKQAILNAGLEYNKHTLSFASQLARASGRTDLDMEFHLKPPGSGRITNLEQVHRICQLMEQGLTDTQISRKYSELYGEFISPPPINMIRFNCPPEWWPVVSQYNINHTPTYGKYDMPDEVIHMICQMMVAGKSVDEIRDAANMNDRNRESVRRFFVDLRLNKRSIYNHITMQYFPPGQERPILDRVW